jgi:L-galactose dehydrogenase
MKYQRLGKTDLDVSAVTFGTGPLGGLFGDVDDEQAHAVVREAMEHGINMFDTSPYYGSAEQRLGEAVKGRRDDVLISTKVGLYGHDDADFTPARIRSGFDESLRLLKTDYVDVLMLHDIANADSIDAVLGEAYETVVQLRDAGKCRYIGASDYNLELLIKAMVDVDLDVVLTYAHGTLLDDSLSAVLEPVAAEQGVGLMNAAAVALGLLTNTTDWFRHDVLPDGSSVRHTHPATEEIQQSAKQMIALCRDEGADISFIATQYAIQCAGAPTTVVGTTKSHHLRSAVEAVDAPIDADLLARLLALRPVHRTW